MVKSLNSSADLPNGDVQVVDTFEPAGVLVDPDFLFSAEFIRLGDDLLLRGPDGGQILLRDYFAQDPPPQLHTAEGARLTAETVEALAVPEAPLAYAQAGDLQYGQPIGEVSELNGIARVQRPDGTRDDLKEGDPVFQGDVVSTGVGSELGILFIDDTVFSLSANARMVINELIYTPSSTANSMGVSLIQGTFVFITGQIAPNGGIEVDTPVGTIGIRGTTVGVQIATFGGFTRISNLTNPDSGETGSFIFSNNIADALFTLSNHYLEIRSANTDPGLPSVISGQDISDALGRALNTALQIQRNPNRTIEPQSGTDEQQGENQEALQDLEALLAQQPILETAAGPTVLSGGSSFAANLTLTGSNGGAGFGGGLSGLTPTGTLGALGVPGFGLLNIDSSSLPPNTQISLSSAPLQVAEGSLVQVSVASLGVSGATAGTVFNVVAVSNGAVVFIAPGAAPVPVTSFTLQQLQNGQIFFAHDGSETTQAGFAVNVGNSGVVAVPITVDPVNDAPVLVNNSLTVAGGATVVLSEANLSATDVDNPPADLVFTISGTAPEQFLQAASFILAADFGAAASSAPASGGTIGGRFELAGNPGTAITSFTQQQVIDGVVIFVDDGDSIPPSYGVSVSDGEFSTPPSTVSVSFVGTPFIILDLPGADDSLAEDSTLSDESNTVNLTVLPQGDDQLTEIVISGLQPDWSYDLSGLDTDGAGGAVTVSDNIAGDGTVTITFAPGSNTVYAGSFAVQPPADSDADHPRILATATAVDPTNTQLTTTGQGSLDIAVDAVLDAALELGLESVTGVSEAVAAQTIGLGLDVTAVRPFAGSGNGGADDDGSETTVVTLTLNGALPVGAVLSSTAGTVTPTGDPLVFEVTGANLEAAIDNLQVQVPDGFAGVISGTVSALSSEANTPPGSTRPASGNEPDTTNNTSSDAVAFTVTVAESVPLAVDDQATAPAAALARPQNIAIFIDRSGSISDAEFQQELNTVRAFIQTLIDRGSPDTLAFSMVAFNATAVDYGTYLYDGTGNGLGDFARVDGSGNLDSLLTPVSGIPNPTGNTNFNAALTTLFENPNYLDNAVTEDPEHADRLFILSDSNITVGGSTVTESNRDSLQNNAIEVAPVAIGESVDPANFVAFFGTDIVPDTNAVLTDAGFTELAETLVETLVGDAVATGNLLNNDDAGLDNFGAPEAITQILHDSQVYNDASDGNIDGFIDISTTAGGGALRVDSETGDFEYFISSPESFLTEEFTYTLVDGDGDSDTATLVINVELPADALPKLAPASFATTSETVMPDETDAAGDLADTFVFTSAQWGGELDVVTDYNPGENDVLDISDLVSFTEGLDDVEAFVTAIADGSGTTLAVSPDGVAPVTPFAFLDGVHQGDSLSVILDATEQSINVA